MSGVLPLSQLTSDFLKSAEAQEFLPELTPLKSAVENNSGHDHQLVFDHIVAVMTGMEEVVLGKFLSPEGRLKLQSYLSQKLGSNQKINLMRLVVLTHDLTKADTLVNKANSQTTCPGHEVLAAGQVSSFQSRFDLKPAEINYAEQIVRLHGTPHELLTLGLAQIENQTQIIHDYNLAVDELGIELILMVYADILGGDLNKLNSTEFVARTNLCQSWLQKLVQDLA